MSRWIVLLILGCWSLYGQVFGQQVPASQGFVNDFVGVLSPGQAQQLNAVLTQYAESSSNEIAIAIMELPEDAILEEFTLSIAEQWGVGGESNDNGLLIAVYPNSRKMRIEVGYGLEGAVPDSRALEVQNKYMKPAFRQGDYYTGLRDAVDALILATRGEYEDAPTSKYYQPDSPETGGGVGQTFVIIAIILLFIFMSRGGGKGGGRGGRGGGGSVLPWILWGSMFGGGGGTWGGGGGSWGGGGGDFGGFGGGDFGGGGASSDW